MKRKAFNISGRVQGVGFRPFVFCLAERHSLTGLVRNGPEGVWIEAQGTGKNLADFAAALQDELPPLAVISALRESDLPCVPDEVSFRIAPSGAGLAHEVLISPDVATCEDCLRDLREAGGRRYRYPFTNCTNCGPRYSITRSMPYDRSGTSMSCFPLCPECLAEYTNPRDRRFHAQPNACPVCGPKVWIPGGPEGQAALEEVAARLKSGRIAAVKGLGGFHLVCDATDDAAVRRLRAAKARPHKPLAVMAADLRAARAFVQVGPDEERLLTSLERPIVLCPALQGGALSRLVSPDTGCIGVMLPYTPLHHLLLEAAGLPLVMTSGNRGGEPIALGNREALERLADIAEVFLLHDRDILIRTDDSVVRPLPGDMLESGDAAVLHLRRARGFVPAPLPLPARLRGRPALLGLGAELKNTICLSRGGEAFVSQHIGDLQNLETSAFQGEMARHLAAVLQVEPAAAALDAHPDFVNSAVFATTGGCAPADPPGRAGQSPLTAFATAGGLRRELPLLRLQHHFAHAEAVLAENGVDGPALVLALDGTGYAPPQLDGNGSIWGGELLLAHPAQHSLRRVGSLALMPLPGGEAAIRQPWRIAHAFLHQLGLLEKSGGLPWLPAWEKSARVIPLLLERRLNTPPTSSAGRLFDAVSALLGLCLEITYEGQAAIRLEEAQFAGKGAPRSGGGWRELYAGAARLPCPVIEGPRPGLELGLDTGALFRAVFDLARSGGNTAHLARSFHFSLAAGLADLALAASRRHGAGLVGLSGGVMQNLSLSILLKDALRARGLAPLTHRSLPPGDGCISFGQVVWGLEELNVARQD